MARTVAMLVFLVLPCAAFNYLNWKHMLAPETTADDLPGQQVELDGGLDSVVMMQTVATPVKEPEGFARVASGFAHGFARVSRARFAAPLANEDL